MIGRPIVTDGREERAAVGAILEIVSGTGLVICRILRLCRETAILE
jgi:hypothetical protein